MGNSNNKRSIVRSSSRNSNCIGLTDNILTVANNTYQHDLEYDADVYNNYLVRQCLTLQLHSIILHRSNFSYPSFLPQQQSINHNMIKVISPTNHINYSRNYAIEKTNLSQCKLPNTHVTSHFLGQWNVLMGPSVIGYANNCDSFDYYFYYQGDKVSESQTFEFNPYSYYNYRKNGYHLISNNASPYTQYLLKSNKNQIIQHCACKQCIHAYQAIIIQYKSYMQEIILTYTTIKTRTIVDSLLSYFNYTDALEFTMDCSMYSNYCIDVLFFDFNIIGTKADLYRANSICWSYLANANGLICHK